MLRLLSYLLDFVMAFVFAKAIGKLFRSGSGGGTRVHFRTHPGAAPPEEPPRVHSGQTARDPVCGMFVSTELSHRLTVGGETLHFCSRECLERYQKESAHVSS
jgi:YHS domain-containing protein